MGHASPDCRVDSGTEEKKGNKKITGEPELPYPVSGAGFQIPRGLFHLGAERLEHFRYDEIAEL
jgi:hypothetical protein